MALMLQSLITKVLLKSKMRLLLWILVGFKNTTKVKKLICEDSLRPADVLSGDCLQCLFLPAFALLLQLSLMLLAKM